MKRNKENYAIQRALRNVLDKVTCPFCGKCKRAFNMLCCKSCADAISHAFRTCGMDG